MRAALFFGLLSVAGCFTPIAKHCPTCTITDLKHPFHPKKETERVFVLVPGVIGFGWEWDDALVRLRQAPATEFVVFDYSGWSGAGHIANDLWRVVQTLMWSAPSVKEWVVVAHSGAGIPAAHAVAKMRVPKDKRFTLATVGTPFAGMHADPASMTLNPMSQPIFFAVAQTFNRYPRPAPGVEILEFVTPYPPDPVMMPRFGHDPGDPSVGPVGRKRIVMDPKHGHNNGLQIVIDQLLRQNGAATTASAH